MQVRTNAVKWAWSMYRRLLPNQTAHMRPVHEPHGEPHGTDDHDAARDDPRNQVPAAVTVDVHEFVRIVLGAGQKMALVRSRAEALAALLNTKRIHHITYENMQADAQARKYKIHQNGNFVYFTYPRHRPS